MAIPATMLVSVDIPFDSDRIDPSRRVRGWGAVEERDTGGGALEDDTFGGEALVVVVLRS
jgi:hypothetical protein